MLLLYNIGVRLYFLAVYIASFFNKKAKLWIEGRKNQRVATIDSCTWFHFASLGEFEQGRPVLEALRARDPDGKIVITFFSPSGYQIRKNTPLADAVYYLPLDTHANAKEFIAAIKPKQAIFTKYEYWYYFFNELSRKKVPLYVISAIFRPGQLFFKLYGSLHRRMLRMVTHFFVQDQDSLYLLRGININCVTVSGDTRFDRVWAHANHAKKLPLVAAFKGNNRVFVAGSTWPADENLLNPLVTKYPEWKFVFAPHEIIEEKINNLIELLPPKETIRFSELAALDDAQLSAIRHRVLVIDNIGMLSSLYQYGDVAYIGGGFGKGIHNTLEAAAFGLPVLFGPNYKSFKEARDIIEIKAGLSVRNATQLFADAELLINNANYREFAGEKIKDYVRKNIGATEKIIAAIK